MTGKNKKKDNAEISTPTKDDGAISITAAAPPINPSTPPTDILVQLLLQQQQQFMQQQQQFMQQHQQMAQILANISTAQQGTPITQTSTPLLTTSTKNTPKAQVHSTDKLKLDVSLRGAQEWKLKWSDYATMICILYLSKNSLLF